MLKTRENYKKKKKKQDRKVLEGIKWEETKNCNKQGERQKVGEQCCIMNSARMNQIRRFHFLCIF